MEDNYEEEIEDENSEDMLADEESLVSGKVNIVAESFSFDSPTEQTPEISNKTKPVIMENNSKNFSQEVDPIAESIKVLLGSSKKSNIELAICLEVNLPPLNFMESLANSLDKPIKEIIHMAIIDYNFPKEKIVSSILSLMNEPQINNK